MTDPVCNPFLGPGGFQPQDGDPGYANRHLSNLLPTAINAGLNPASPGVLDLGTSAQAWADLYLAGTSLTPAVNRWAITGVATDARTLTLPDSSGVLWAEGNVSSGAGVTITPAGVGSARTFTISATGTGANRALSNLSAVAINTSLLPGASGSIDLGDAAHAWRNLRLAGTIVGVTTALTGTKNNALTISVPTQGIDDANGVGLVIASDAAGSGGTGNHTGGPIAINLGAGSGSGVPGGFSINATVAPTSGTVAYALASLLYTVNQTGGANGAVTGLLLNATETAPVGVHTLFDLQIGGISKCRVLGQTPIASAAGAVWDFFKVSSIAQDFTGNTHVTSVAGINEVAFYPPTLNSNLATLTIDRAATLFVAGAPNAGPNVAITKPYGICVGGATANIYLFSNGTSPLSLQANNDIPPDAANPYIRTGAGGSIFIESFASSGLFGAIHLNFVKAADVSLVYGGGNVGLGILPLGTNASKCLGLTNSAVAPTTSADICHLFAKDHNGVAGAAALAVYQEAALVASGDKAATHEFLATINGTPVWILCRDSA